MDFCFDVLQKFKITTRRSACIVTEILWIKLKNDLCLQKWAFFTLCLKHQYWLKIGCFWKYLFIIEFLPRWFFGSLTLFDNFNKRYTQCFSFRNRSCPTKVWLKYFGVYTSIFKNLKNPLRQCTCFHQRWGSIWLNKNWVWFDFSRHGFIRKRYPSIVSKTKILLSSWKRSNSNTVTDFLPCSFWLA